MIKLHDSDITKYDSIEKIEKYFSNTGMFIYFLFLLALGTKFILSITQVFSGAHFFASWCANDSAKLAPCLFILKLFQWPFPLLNIKYVRGRLYMSSNIVHVK